MLIKFLLFVAGTATAVDGLAFSVFNAFQANPHLSEVAEAKMGEKFTVRMDIGNKKDDTRMYLDGLCIELLQDQAAKDDKVGLPGANGPHPKTSTGAMALNVLSTPSFVDMFGTQKVRFEKACWEMIWRKDNHCGSVICGFNLPMGAKRNGANLPAGRMYLSFPVWSQEGLAIRQAERFQAEEKAKGFAKERDEHLLKYQTETNLFKKAMHYRNAAAAVEQYDFTGVRTLSQVPLDAEVAPIGNRLLISMKGTVWNKESAFFGARHTQLGEAVLAPVKEEVEEMSVLRP